MIRTEASFNLKKPSRRNGGLDLTVCLAALCERGQKLICISDRFLAFSPHMTAIDGVVCKDAAIHKNWFGLYAANDITDVRPIIERATMLLSAKKRELAL